MPLALLRSSPTARRPAAERERERRLEPLPQPPPHAAPIDLEALSSRWRAALNAAQDALVSAGRSIDAAELNDRRTRLTRERSETARLLESIAHEERVSLVHRLEGPRPTLAMLGLPPGTAACVFDLEGVLTGSAAVHAAAWAETFEPFLLARAEKTGERFGPYAPFNPRTDYVDHIHGRPRLEGVRAFLASRGIRLPEGEPADPPGAETVHGLANRKNEAFLHRLATEGITPFEGSRRYLDAVRDAGVRSAVVSASANTLAILDRAGLRRLVDQRVDGTTIVADRLRAWPAPDVLLAACRKLGVEPDAAAVFETAPAGVAAGRAARFALVVGVDRRGDGEALRQSGADLVVTDLAELLDPALGGRTRRTA
jgi:HAD superfamily hydrolase (TIGR01509 family)